MSTIDPVLEKLIELTRTLGEPALDYAILGEGNSSAAAGEETFYVKASGRTLHNIGADGFVRVRCGPILAMLEREQLSDDEIQAGLMAARVDARRPSRRWRRCSTPIFSGCRACGSSGTRIRRP